MNRLDDECRTAGVLPAALDDVRTRYAKALAEGTTTADVGAFVAGLVRDRKAAFLFKRSGGGGAGGASRSFGHCAEPDEPRVIRGPAGMTAAILDPEEGNTTLRAIAAGTLIVEGSTRSPLVDVGAPPGWHDARARARDVAALSPLPTTDVLAQRVLAEIAANPTATASAIVKKLGVRRSAGLRAVRRAKDALGTGEPDRGDQGAS